MTNVRGLSSSSSLFSLIVISFLHGMFTVIILVTNAHDTRYMRDKFESSLSTKQIAQILREVTERIGASSASGHGGSASSAIDVLRCVQASPSTLFVATIALYASRGGDVLGSSNAAQTLVQLRLHKSGPVVLLSEQQYAILRSRGIGAVNAHQAERLMEAVDGLAAQEDVRHAYIHFLDVPDAPDAAGNAAAGAAVGEAVFDGESSSVLRRDACCHRMFTLIGSIPSVRVESGTVLVTDSTCSPFGTVALRPRAVDGSCGAPVSYVVMTTSETPRSGDVTITNVLGDTVARGSLIADSGHIEGEGWALASKHPFLATPVLTLTTVVPHCSSTLLSLTWADSTEAEGATRQLEVIIADASFNAEANKYKFVKFVAVDGSVGHAGDDGCPSAANISVCSSLMSDETRNRWDGVLRDMVFFYGPWLKAWSLWMGDGAPILQHAGSTAVSRANFVGASGVGEGPTAIPFWRNRVCGVHAAWMNSQKALGPKIGTDVARELSSFCDSIFRKSADCEQLNRGEQLVHDTIDKHEMLSVTGKEVAREWVKGVMAKAESLADMYFCDTVTLGVRGNMRAEGEFAVSKVEARKQFGGTAHRASSALVAASKERADRVVDARNASHADRQLRIPTAPHKFRELTSKLTEFGQRLLDAELTQSVKYCAVTIEFPAHITDLVRRVFGRYVTATETAVRAWWVRRFECDASLSSNSSVHNKVQFLSELRVLNRRLVVVLSSGRVLCSCRGFVSMLCGACRHVLRCVPDAAVTRDFFGLRYQLDYQQATLEGAKVIRQAAGWSLPSCTSVSDLSGWLSEPSPSTAAANCTCARCKAMCATLSSCGVKECSTCTRSLMDDVDDEHGDLEDGGFAFMDENETHDGSTDIAGTSYTERRDEWERSKGILAQGQMNTALQDIDADLERLQTVLGGDFDSTAVTAHAKSLIGSILADASGRISAVLQETRRRILNVETQARAVSKAGEGSSSVAASTESSSAIVPFARLAPVVQRMGDTERDRRVGP